jgi:hypothetical protein
MKFKKRYVLLLALVITFPFFYNQYGWIWNPWAAERLVWDEPNPELIGQTFSITVPATYIIDLEAGDGPVGKQGVTRVITLDIGQPLNKPSGQYYRIQPDDVFTIQKTYWIRINGWAQSFHSPRKIAIVIDKNGQKYIFSFMSFFGTNRPDFSKIETAELNTSPWDFKNAEILYGKN